MASLLSDQQRAVFVKRLKLEMAQRGLSRELLAEKASCKERTLGNLLAGSSVRDSTIFKLARVVGLDINDLIEVKTPNGSDALRVASEAYGGYLLASCSDLIGTYLGYRRVFSREPRFSRGVYEIYWDDDDGRLSFFAPQSYRAAGERVVSDNHAGAVHISPTTNLIQLLTSYQGALRLMTLNKPRLGDMTLRGVVLTQADRERYYEPAVSACFLKKLAEKKTPAELEKLAGTFGSTDPEFGFVSSELAGIEKSSVFIAQ